MTLTFWPKYLQLSSIVYLPSKKFLGWDIFKSLCTMNFGRIDRLTDGYDKRTDRALLCVGALIMSNLCKWQSKVRGKGFSSCKDCIFYIKMFLETWMQPNTVKGIKSLTSWVCMPNIKFISLMVQKLWPRLNIQSHRTKTRCPQFHLGEGGG